MRDRSGDHSFVKILSVAGRSIPATTLGTGPQTILLIATIHGAERLDEATLWARYGAMLGVLIGE